MSTILLIEDDLDQLLFLKAMLDHMGHQVLQAADGYQGINLFRANKVDVVITDIFMPEKEGLSTIVDIRELAPDVKIIAMTAGSDALHNALEIAADLGANFTLKKPISLEELSAALCAALAAVMD